MTTFTSHRSTFMGCAAGALALLSGAGCGEDEGNDPRDVNGAYQELATQLQNCANDALDCVNAAACNDVQQQVCRDQFRECREATRDA